MKVAIALLWNPPYTNCMSGGMTYAPFYLSKDLKKKGFEVDNIYFFDTQPNNIHSDFIRYPYEDFLILNNYDYIIFTTAGSWNDRKLPWWREYLSKINKPFAVVISDEVEIKTLIYREDFFSHPRCKLLLPLTPEVMVVTAPNHLDKPYMVYPLFSANVASPEKYFEKKTRSIITLCRLTNRKRILELVMQSELLHRCNFTLDIYGADVTWTYKLKLKEQLNQFWNYHGTFEDHKRSSICIPATYQWNASKLKRSTFYPRIEISSFEGLSYGVCQILCKSTVPSWVDDSMAILVDPFDLNRLAEMLLDNFRDANQKCLNLINKLNESGVRLDKLCKLIKENFTG